MRCVAIAFSLNDSQRSISIYLFVSAIPFYKHTNVARLCTDVCLTSCLLANWFNVQLPSRQPRSEQDVRAPGRHADPGVQDLWCHFDRRVRVSVPYRRSRHSGMIRAMGQEVALLQGPLTTVRLCEWNTTAEMSF
jgi:hypothetical protein